MSTETEKHHLSCLPAIQRFIKILDDQDEIEFIITHGYQYRVVTFHSIMYRLISNDPCTKLYFIQEFNLNNINLVADALMEAVRYEICGMDFNIAAYIDSLKLEYRGKLMYEPNDHELPIP